MTKIEGCSSAPSTFSLPIMALLLVGSFVLLSFNVSRSQALAAPPITPSGLNTQVDLSVIPPAGTVQYDITGGTRPGGGTNLFHSFGDFNVPTNNIANFLNDSGLPTSNILGRVTGGNISNIFGTIQTTGFGNANLFLMNPTGFLFGPNATVNVGGMVSFTTADYLRLADGVRFNAIPNPTVDALLSAAPVAAFGFLGANPGAITVQGSQFTVTEGKGISLVGGNITVQSGVFDDGVTIQPARLSAPGGQVNIASVASPGEISAGNFTPVSGMTMGDINLSQGATLDVSGNAAGTVRIRGGQLVIADATTSANTGNINGTPTAVDIQITGDMSISDTLGVPAITARSVGDGNAGAVQIISANLVATSTSPETNPFALIDTDASGAGAAGNINIATGNLQASSQIPGLVQFIDSGTVAGPAHGGNVTISAQSVTLEGTGINAGPSLAFSQGLDPAGSSGNVIINADRLTLLNSIIDTSVFGGGPEPAGSITFNARDINLTQSFVTSFGFNGSGAISVAADRFIMDGGTHLDSRTASGPGGGILVSARVVELLNGSTMTTDTLGDGLAGDIRVSATDHVTLSTSPFNFNPSGFFSESIGGVGIFGSGGSVVVTTPRLDMTGGSQINTVTLTSGSGGNVAINSNSISIFGELSSAPGGIFTQTLGSEFCAGPCGDAGQVSINTGSLTMGSGAQINTGTSGTQPGGAVSIYALNTISLSGTLSDGSPGGIFSKSVGTSPDAGAGGNIALTAGQSVTISDGASISASSTGAGDAGTVTIQGLASPAQSVLIDGDGSGISTDTQGTGAGGNIFVNANTFTLQNGGILSATTSGTNNGGDIQVDATAINLLTFGTINTLSFQSDSSAGNIALKATQQITAVDAVLSADAVGIGTGSGRAGNVSLSAPTISVNGGVFSTSTSGSGHGGSIILAGRQISLGASPLAAATGANLFASTNFGSGDGGTIILRGLDGPSSQADVDISGHSTLQTLTGAGGSGNAGDLTINAARFTLTDHAQLTADTFGSGAAGTLTLTATDYAIVSESTVSSSNVFDATGTAGQITVSAPTVMIENGGTISTTTGAAPGGNINILASQSVTMTNGSSISASSTGAGDAGNILINAGQNYTSTNSAVTTQATAPDTEASGGNITVLATDMVQLTNSQLNASVQGSSKTVGGNITIDPQYVILQNSQILAQATQGQGGAISINITNGGLFLPDANSTVSASSQFGVNGTVTIQSPNAPISGQIQPLGKTPLLATSLLNQHCAALAGGEFSSFTVAGRDSLPTEPGSWLASPLAFGLAGTGDGTLPEKGVRAVIKDPADEPALLSLRQIAPAGFLTQAFAVDKSAGCTS